MNGKKSKNKNLVLDSGKVTQYQELSVSSNKLKEYIPNFKNLKFLIPNFLDMN